MVLFPAFGIRRATRGGQPTIAQLRAIFVSYVLALFLIGIVVVVLTVAGERTTSASTATIAGVAAGVAVLGTASVVLSQRVQLKPDCSTDAALLRWYRQRFFLRVALSELPALMGFIGFVLVWTGWIYLIGLGIAVIGHGLAAPTNSRIDRDRERLTASGCRRDLAAALQDTRTS